MNTLTRCLGATAIGALAVAWPATAAIAADATGCSGSAASTDGSGQDLDTAAAPGEGATRDDPFVIDPAGTVSWRGATDGVITDATWSLSVAGVTVRSGSIENASGTTKASGTQDVAVLGSTASGLALTGDQVIPVSFTLTGQGGTCTASGYITGTGSPTSSPMFYAGLASLALGVGAAAAMVAGTRTVAAAGGGA